MLEPTASPQSVEGAAERPDYADDLALAIWCELPRDARIDSVLHMIADKIRPHVAALRSRIEGAAVPGPVAVRSRRVPTGKWIYDDWTPTIIGVIEDIGPVSVEIEKLYLHPSAEKVKGK